MVQTLDYDTFPWHKRILRKARRWFSEVKYRASNVRTWRDALIVWSFIIIVPTIIFGPFLLHIAYCLMAERAIMLAILIFGLVVPPIGWFHGLLIFLSWIF